MNTSKFNYTLLTFFTISVFGMGQVDSLIKAYDGSQDPTSKLKTALEISNETLYSDGEMALKYASKADSLRKYVDDPLLHVKVLSNKAALETNNGKRELVYQYLDEGINLLSKIDSFSMSDEHKASYAILLSNYGAAKHDESKFDEAINYFLRALPLSRSVGDGRRECILLYNISLCHAGTGNYDKAIASFKEIRDLEKTPDTEMIIAAAANAIGATYYDLDSFNQAKPWLFQAIQDSEEKNYQRVLREAYVNLGLIYESFDQLDSTEYFFNKAEEKNTESYDNHTALILYTNWIRLATKNGNITKANKLIAKVESINEDIGHQVVTSQVLAFKALISTNQDWKSRSLMLERSIELKDSIYSSESKQVIIDAEEKYKSVENNNKLLQQEILLSSRQKKIAYLTSGLIFNLLGIFLLYGFYQNSKRKNQLVQQELELKNMALEASEKEKNILALAASLEGQEVERVRIAKDLHDGLGGLLSTVKAHFGNIADEIKKIESINIYKKANEMMDEACEEVRRISHNLMPGTLRLEGLKSALSHYADQLNDAHPFDVKLEIIGVDGRLEESKEVFIYRIIQELSNNVIKYAQARHLLIQLTETDMGIDIIVEDDGVGFDPNAIDKRKGLGLRSIQSRVAQLNGHWDIDARIGKGTSVSVMIPK